MNDIVFVTLAVTGFAVGFLHAVIPTHWLPFAAAARAQHWTNTKTLTITGFAGVGHVLFTTALGGLVVWGGMAINSRIGKDFPFIAGGALIALGIFYLVRQFMGHGHVHLFEGHSPDQHDHDHHHHTYQSIEEEERALELN